MNRNGTHSGRERGQAILLVVVAMSLFLIGALGLAIDGSQMYAHQQMARAAADAAAQAGILSIYRGTNTTAPSFGTGVAPGPFTCTTGDGRTPCVYARRNGFGGTVSDTVTVSFPATVAGVSNLSSSGVAAISVSVQRNVKTGLIRFLRSGTTSTVRAIGTAGLIASAPDCITVLAPAGNAALSVSNNGNLSLTNCGLTVNSSDAQAFTVSNNANVDADSINIVGGYTSGNNATITPLPTINAPPAGDPFASVPAPAYSAAGCITNTFITNNQIATLNPGVYCGGIRISNNASVFFNPGTYVLLGGGLNAANNVTLTGLNVTFYNTFDGTHAFSPVSLSNNIFATLSATTSGSLKGILFFEDRAAPAGFTDLFDNNSSQNFTGVLYFPRDNLSLSNNGSLGTRNMAIVANTVQVSNNASLRLTLDLSVAGAPQKLGIALVK